MRSIGSDAYEPSQTGRWTVLGVVSGGAFVKVRVQSWGLLSRRLGWPEKILEAEGDVTVREALQRMPGIPAGGELTGNAGDTLYEIMTRNDSVRVDKWLCINGRIQTARAEVLDKALNDGDELLVMEATLSGGG